MLCPEEFVLKTAVMDDKLKGSWDAGKSNDALQAMVPGVSALLSLLGKSILSTQAVRAP